MKSLFTSALILLLAAPLLHAEADAGLQALFPDGVIDDQGESASLDSIADKPVTPKAVLVGEKNRIVRHLTEEPATVV